MIDLNDPVVSVKKELLNWLKSQESLNYLDIIENHPAGEVSLPLKKPLISFGNTKVTASKIGFYDDLGDYYDEATGEAAERKGYLMNLYFNLHLWNGTAKNMGGEREIERIIGKLFNLFELNKFPDDIQYKEFETGETGQDPEDPVFHCMCSLNVSVLIYTETISAAIEDIIIKGRMVI